VFSPVIEWGVADLSSYEGWAENARLWEIRAAEQLDESRRLTEQLRGQRLLGVRYYLSEGGFSQGDRSWDRGIAHLADYGLDLITSGGTTGITWTQGFLGSNILGIVDHSLIDQLGFLWSLAVTWVPASDEPWLPIIGTNIAGSRLLEEEIGYTGAYKPVGSRTSLFEPGVNERSAIGPVALSLRFENGESLSLVSAMEYELYVPHGEWVPLQAPGQSVVVIWRTEAVELLLPGREAGRILFE
jgi:hypothetical protein